MRDFKFTESERPTMANFNARFDAIAALANGLGNEYVWERFITTYLVEIASKSEGSNWIFSYNSPQESVIIEYSNVVYVDGSKKIRLENPSSIEVTAGTAVSTLQSLLRGKFVYKDGNGTLYSPIKVGDDAVFSMEGSLNTLLVTTWYDLSVGAAQLVSYGYVNSPDPSAYPPAEDDGYTYTALGQLGNKVRIETGSYVGTGTYGSSNPNSLTFDFEPKLVIVQSEFQAGMLFWVYGMSGTVYRILRSSSTEYVGKITFSDNTLTWYGTNAENQMNYSNYVYHYIAIG